MMLEDKIFFWIYAIWIEGGIVIVGIDLGIIYVYLTEVLRLGIYLM